MVVLAGAPGLRARVTAKAAADALGRFESWSLDGDWRTQGYLAGFEPFLLDLFKEAIRDRPRLVARHEQTLKRIWPQRDCAAFEVPRDLTNTSGKEERTRFYHHEYQNKLLVGLAEFAVEALVAADRRIAVTIDRADALPATSLSLLDVFRGRAQPERIAFLLLDRSNKASFLGLRRITLSPFTLEEYAAYINLRGLGPMQRELIFARSGGDPDLGHALIACLQRGVEPTNSLSAEAIIDLHLACLDRPTRLEMAATYVDAGFAGGVVSRRNLDTLLSSELDESNAIAHEQRMARYRAGEGPLAIGHALAIRDKYRRLDAVIEACEVLMGIGLYDTWFDFFAEMFSDRELWKHGSGDDPVNGLFINAAFVLYAMGHASAALSFLEDFLARFPDSRFVPTALYAQSMTYGRYQTPIDIPRAEVCAQRNLNLIEAKFRGHPRYTYIKVFAENAYAYIKARQGRFDEALELCENGISEIVAAYGDSHFRLHRSILIYNTSQVYELVGDMVRAEERLREAIACDPYYAEYYNDLGNLLSRLQNRESEALAAYARAIELSPPYYEAHLNRGVLRAQTGNVSGAEQDFHRVLEIKPCEWRARRELGNLRLHAGNAAGALNAYDEALRHESRDADLQANAGLAASELGQTARALDHFKTALALNPRHAGAHNNLAAELVGVSRAADALPHARLAVEYGDDPEFAANLAEIERLCM